MSRTTLYGSCRDDAYHKGMTFGPASSFSAEVAPQGYHFARDLEAGVPF
jgi:hypothetical protein